MLDFSVHQENVDLIFDIKYSSLRDLEINAFDRRTDGQKSDPLRVLCFPLVVRNPKNEHCETSI